jgi:catechol 2,3-dioxygenase
MTSQTLSTDRVNFSIHPATQIGHVSLVVADLDSQVSFYQQVLGFQLHWREGKRAGLGAGGADLLQLSEEDGVRKYRGVTGLYHFAVVLPSRRELGRAIARLFTLRYPNYPTDHIMTKTTYLDDPEGNGIELYAESPEDGTFVIENGDFVTRRADGSLSDGREPLDVEALFRLLNEDDQLDAPLPAKARIGHVHLHVRDVQEAVDFYHGVLGFDLKGFSSTFQAAFLSAGGYHHHIGLNSWQGKGAPPPPGDASGMHHFTVTLSNRKALDEVVERVDQAGIPYNEMEKGLLLYDPSQNGVLLSLFCS